MKTTYTCEICGKEFPDWEECSKHEKTCEEVHATGMRLTKQLVDTIASAREHGSCKVGVRIVGIDTVYRIIGAVYNPPQRAIELDLLTEKGDEK